MKYLPSIFIFDLVQYNCLFAKNINFNLGIIDGVYSDDRWYYMTNQNIQYDFEIGIKYLPLIKNNEHIGISFDYEYYYLGDMAAHFPGAFLLISFDIIKKEIFAINISSETGGGVSFYSSKDGLFDPLGFLSIQFEFSTAFKLSQKIWIAPYIGSGYTKKFLENRYYGAWLIPVKTGCALQYHF